MTQAASWVVALAVYGLFLLAPRLDPGRANYPRFRGAFLVLRVAILAVLALLHGAIIASALGRSVPMDRIVAPGMGVLFAVIGLMLGKVRPNWFVGIRTPWTLSSNVGAAVNPELTYLKVQHRGEVYYVGKTAFTAARSEEEVQDEVEVEVDAPHGKKDTVRLKTIEQLFKEKGKDAYEVAGEVTDAVLERVREAAVTLLSNPVIEDVVAVEVVETVA